MDKYETIGVIGEGSYGVVCRCRNKETGQIVAIKKFLESEDDRQVKKIALREVKMLKLLRHENLINLLEVFRRKKKLYLVFEFMDHTLLQEMEKCPRGLPFVAVRRYLYQLCNAVQFCHFHKVIHRDIKPENVLISKQGVVKLCDFGFARALAGPGEVYTDYVATRWYRAPELLVGDPNYGKPVDVWALGCLFFEMMTSDPLFPGDSDLDQLHHIMRCFGKLTRRQVELFQRNALFVGARLPEPRELSPLHMRLKVCTTPHEIELLEGCLRLDASDRLTCDQLLVHAYFTFDGFNAQMRDGFKTQSKRSDTSSSDGTSLSTGGSDKFKSTHAKTTNAKAGPTLSLRSMNGTSSLSDAVELPLVATPTPKSTDVDQLTAVQPLRFPAPSSTSPAPHAMFTPLPKVLERADFAPRPPSTKENERYPLISMHAEQAPSSPVKVTASLGQASTSSFSLPQLSNKPSQQSKKVAVLSSLPRLGADK